MSGLESAALGAGKAVMKHMATAWLANKKAEARRGAHLTELISLRFEGVPLFQRNNLRRKLAEIGDVTGMRLLEVCERKRLAMKTLTYSESRTRFAEVLATVANDREEVVITRAGQDPVVMVPLDDYESLKETVHLLRSPENARRLLASIDRLEINPA
jgi:antitoxin YefM